MIYLLSASAIVSLLALAYFSGFIGIEIEDEEETQKTPAQIPDGYGEGANESNSHLQKYDDHPGWLWDSASEEWVVDPDFED